MMSMFEAYNYIRQREMFLKYEENMRAEKEYISHTQQRLKNADINYKPTAPICIACLQTKWGCKNICEEFKRRHIPKGSFKAYMIDLQNGAELFD